MKEGENAIIYINILQFSIIIYPLKSILDKCLVFLFSALILFVGV